MKELGTVLLNIKNNKTPSMDEFFKVFWCDLKIFILRTINRCNEKGLLSISSRSAVITCIPKGDKSRELLKNWRPISLLSSLYKLASATIAGRFKKVLDKLISDSQCGFIKGRIIGEST